MKHETDRPSRNDLLVNEAGQRCPSCGTSRRDLYTDGRMGCADCYAVFEAEVAVALQEIHGAVQHIGKA